MSNRFTRDYELKIGVDGQVLVVRPPFNISFSATENIINKSLNKLNLTITGLGEANRQKLIKDELNIDTFLPIEFFVGYQGSLYRAFKGSIRTGELERSGAEFVNTLECYDGHPDFTQSFTSKTVTGRQLSVDAILEDMPNTEKGAVTKLTETLRPKVLVGSSSELLSRISEGKQFYIKDQKIFILNDDEVVSRVAPLVYAKTGLKNTPKQDNIETTFVTVLNPELKIGQLCSLKSVTNPDVNGIYKIYQIVTNGSYKGEWEQTVTARRANNFKVVR